MSALPLDERVQPLSNQILNSIVEKLIDSVENFFIESNDISSQVSEMINSTMRILQPLEASLPTQLLQQVANEASLRSPLAGIVVQALLSKFLSSISLEINVPLPNLLLVECFHLLEDSIFSISLPSSLITDEILEALTKSKAAVSIEHIKADEFLLSSQGAAKLSQLPKLKQLEGEVNPAIEQAYAIQKKYILPNDRANQVTSISDATKLDEVDATTTKLKITFRSNQSNLNLDFGQLQHLTHLDLESVGPFYTQLQWPASLQTLRVRQYTQFPPPENEIDTCTLFCERLIENSPNLLELTIETRCIDFRRQHVKMLLDGLKYLERISVRNLRHAKVYDDESEEESDDDEDNEPVLDAEPLEIVHNHLRDIPYASGVIYAPKYMPGIRTTDPFRAEFATGSAATLLERVPNLTNIHSVYPMEQYMMQLMPTLAKSKMLRTFSAQMGRIYVAQLSILKSLQSIQLSERLHASEADLANLLASLPLLARLDISIGSGDDANMKWLTHKNLASLHLHISYKEKKQTLSLTGASLPSLQQLSLSFTYDWISQLDISNMNSLTKVGFFSTERKLMGLSITACPRLFRIRLRCIYLLSLKIHDTPHFSVLGPVASNARVSDEKTLLHNCGDAPVVAVQSSDESSSWNELATFANRKGIKMVVSVQGEN